MLRSILVLPALLVAGAPAPGAKPEPFYPTKVGTE
jgi:hypothetical protein